MGRVIFTGGSLSMQAPSAGVLASSLEVGSSVYLMEDGSAVEYLVVNQGIPGESSLYDSSCDGTWLLRKDIYASMVWDSTDYFMFDYSASTINTYLNGTFFNRFNSIEQEAIKQINLPYRIGSAGSTMGNFATKIFLPSSIEVNGYPISVHDGALWSYFEGTVSNNADSKRIAYLNGSAHDWWTRSSKQESNADYNMLYLIGTTGGSAGDSAGYAHGIRPALVLPSNSLFDKDTMILKG